MTGSYCMPIGGNFTPPVIYPQQDKSNHHLLGSALLGGAAAYGAYKLNLDIIKDSMSAEAFEDAVRSGRKFDTRTWSTSEKSLLAQARKDIIPAADPEIERIFSTNDSVNMYKYLRERHGSHIRTAQDLEKAIDDKTKKAGTEGDTSYADLEKQDKKRPQFQELKKQSDKLTNIEDEMVKKHAKKESLKKIIAGEEDAKRLLGEEKGLAEIKKAKKELASIEGELERLKGNRNSCIEGIKRLMKSANIKDSIEKLGGGIYTKFDDLTADLEIKMHDPKAADATAKRKLFFETCYDTALSRHEEMLTRRPQVDETVAGMKTDLELVREAEAGNGHITKSMAQEAYQKLGSEVGKGEESIAKAFEALGKKLPGAGSWKKAGLLGVVVALGLYCFKDS